MRIYVFNGPNLDLLGEREPEIYGTRTLEEVEKLCRERAAELGCDLEFRQTNDEGQLIEWLHEARNEADGIVINPAAFTHYSMTVREAVALCEVPVIEVHISNIYAREEWRAKSVISGVATGVIAGLGTLGYLRAIETLSEMIKEVE